MSDTKHTTIYLEVDDEITSVAEKLRNTEAAYVTLVIPKSAIILQSIVNLKLLGRVSEKLKKKVAVVATDKGSRNIIARAGILMKKRVSDDFPVEVAKPEEIEPELGETVRVKASDSAPVPRVEDEDVEPTGPKKIEVKTYEPEKERARAATPSAKPEPAPKQAMSQEKSGGDRSDHIKALKSRRERAVSKSRLPSKYVKLLSLFIGIVLIVAAGILYFILPSATVTLVPKTEPAADDINIAVVTSGSPDESLTEVAGTFVETDVSETKTFSATGEKDFGEKATGSVTISNTFSSDPQPLVAGTRLESKSGKIYKLDEAVTVPGAKIQAGDTVAGKISATATAEDFGDEYNSGSISLSIPGLSAAKQEEITATSSGFDGGTSETKKVVSDDDVANAKKELEESIVTKAREELGVTVPAGETLIDSAIKTEVTKSETSVAIDDAADEFDLTVDAKAIGISFNEDDLKSKAFDELAKRLEGSKVFVEGETEESASFAVDNFDEEDKRMIVVASVEKVAIPELDLAQYKSDVVELDEAGVRSYFAEISEIESVSVDFWPFWVSSVPGNTEKIDIKLDTQ